MRWWDGTQWTMHTQRAEDAAVQAVSTGSPADASSAGGQHAKFPGRKRDLRAEVERLRQVVEGMGVPQLEALRAETGALQQELPQLRREQQELLTVVGPLRSETASLAAQRAQLASVQDELRRLQAQRDAMAASVHEADRLTAALAQLRAEQKDLSAKVVETREIAILQEVGVYQYRHPLTDAVAYKAQLAGVQARIKDAVKAGSAVRGATNWTVNNSAREGAKMVREFSKLMLRAYNNEADNAVRSMKSYALQSSVARLDKARETISKLGGTMNIRVTDSYHRLRVEELQLTADYLAKTAEEKERAREERARLREEEIAQREYRREQERLEKEKAHYDGAAAALREKGDIAGAEKIEAKLAEIQAAIDGIIDRAANIRAGHVYVISNVGAFGENMVKIGMTRRQDPNERIRELGDASVPFHYDVHALVLSDDAVGLETQLHRDLASRRVNLVNPRREFFHAIPAEVREILLRHQGTIREWVDEPEAAEWRQSETARRQLAAGRTGTAHAL